jgi:hypothetical protein
MGLKPQSGSGSVGGELGIHHDFNPSDFRENPVLDHQLDPLTVIFAIATISKTTSFYAWERVPHRLSERCRVEWLHGVVS